MKLVLKPRSLPLNTVLVATFILNFAITTTEASLSEPANSETQKSNKFISRSISVRDIMPEPVKLINSSKHVASVQDEHILDRPRRQSGATEKHFGPKLIHQPQSVLVSPYKPHTVECPIESNPTAEVKWFKDDQLLMSQPTHLEQTGTELMFFQMNDEDSGQYHCEATNYLGSISSEPFRLTVQSSVRDPRVRLEPRFAETDVDQQVEFTCSFPAPSGKISTTTRQQRRPDVGWRRNGRKLTVKWLQTSDQDLDGQGTGNEGVRSRYVARQVTNAIPADVTMFTLTIMKTQLKDDNASFSCLVGASLIEGNQVSIEELARESNQIKLRVYSQEKQRQQPGETAIVNMNPGLAPPLDNLLSNDVLYLNSSSGKRNPTTQLTPDQTTRRISSLKETLSDLYEISKPTLLGFVIIIIFLSIIILSQRAYTVRKNKLENRYIKHHTYSNSSGSGGSGVSSSINAMGIDCGDSHIDSLIKRTISAQSAISLSGNINGLNGGKKYRSYRDQLRKVGTVNDNVADFVAGSDFVNVNGYLLSATSHTSNTSQTKQNNSNNNNCQGSENNEPFFISSELPNLYNQSLAAREQARSLLQASEHMRSLGNLQIASQKQQQQHKFHHQVASALGQRFNGAKQNGSHLNLPLSFAFKDENGSSQSGSANNTRIGDEQLQHLHNRPLEGPSQLLASALWNEPQANLQSNRHKQFNHLQIHDRHHQQQQQQINENYQLVNCSSISPCSSSSTSSSNSHGGGQQPKNSSGPNDQVNQVGLQQHAGIGISRKNVKESNTSLNHYSTIEMNEDDDSRYEEVDNGHQGHSSNKRSSVHLKSSDYHQDSFKLNQIKTSTFVRDNSNNRSNLSNQKSLRSSLMSNSSTSGCGDLNTTNSTVSSNADISAANRFSQRRDKRVHQEIKNPAYQIDNPSKLQYQDQLSPYAVSSICGANTCVPMTTSNQPPPMNSEAMRALNEQFDINHLLLGEPSDRTTPPLTFNSILPPPPPQNEQ